MATLTEAALAIAVSYIGVKETGHNSGPEVDRFLASVGLDPGFAWCASFVFFCFREAAQQLGLVNPVPRTGGVLKMGRMTEPICRATNPAPGYVYILDHGGGVGHAGIIETTNDDGTVTEVSGNTNEAGSREGNAVAQHTGTAPEAIHGGTLLYYLNYDLAVQPVGVS